MNGRSEEPAKKGIMIKSTYHELLEKFGCTKMHTLYQAANVIFPPLKCSSLKHLQDLISVGDVNKERVRCVIRLYKNPEKTGRGTYLHRYEEAYITETAEVDGGHTMLNDTISLKMESQ